MHISRHLILLLSFLLQSAPLLAQDVDFNNFNYGPFDYTNSQHVRDKLSEVEKYHFNSDVENLRGTMSGGAIGAHLLYTIGAFPNHHRALYSVTRLWALSEPTGRPPPGIAPFQTPDYIFERAIRFAPTDGVVRLLYGIYLASKNRKDEAVKQLDVAAELGPDNAEVNYNLGLMYLKLEEHQKADYHASKAYEQGYLLPGLRRKMILAGIWQE